jgi:hypothetical protein
MACPCKGKFKAIEVPSHISFAQAEGLLMVFPGEERLIQKVFMESPTPSHPPLTTDQKCTYSDAGLTPEAKHVMSPPQAPSQEPVAKLAPTPPPPPPVDIVEDTKLPKLFGSISVEEFKNMIGEYCSMFTIMDSVSQNKEAFNFVLPGTDMVLGPWFALRLEGLIPRFKKEKSILPPPHTPADVVTSPEVDKSAPSSELAKVKPAPPPKKEMKGAPGKPVTALHFPLPLPSSQWAPASKDAPPVSVTKHMWHKQGKHTTHGPLCHGIHLMPPMESGISATSFTPAVIDSLNKHIGEDLHGDLCLTLAHVALWGILLQSTHTPTSQEISFMLKHIQKIFPSQNGNHIAQTQISLTSYLKVINVHAIGSNCKMWCKETAELFKQRLKLSPTG